MGQFMQILLIAISSKLLISTMFHFPNIFIFPIFLILGLPSFMTSPALKPSVQLDHQMDNNSGQKQTTNILETLGFDKGSGFHKITGGLQTPHTAGGILKGEGKEEERDGTERKRERKKNGKERNGERKKDGKERNGERKKEGKERRRESLRRKRRIKKKKRREMIICPKTKIAFQNAPRN